MDDAKLKAAVLIISDTAYRDPSTDKSAHVLADVFAADGGDQWTLDHKIILPDDILLMQKQIMRLCDGEEYMNLIITSGGTGFATRDQTPEAITPLIHRHASGLVHGMLAASLEVTPFALMSRPVAGVRNKTLLITLPGSPKGAKENLLAIIKLLPHACIQAAGGDSRTLHIGGVKKLEEDAGISASKNPMHHHHDHSHAHPHGGHVAPSARTTRDERPKSNDIQTGPSRRYRSSPYPMLPVEEAVQLVLAKTPSRKTIKTAVGDTLIGSVLAEDVPAKEAVPAYRASTVDGYAVIVPEGGPSPKGIFPVASVSHASPGDIPALLPGQIARITTGAPLPPGATAAVMVEDTLIRSLRDTGLEENEVEILTDKIEPNENVREIGSDVKAGEIVLRRGEEITAVGGELGLLASVGTAEVIVYQKPIVGVLSSGDEIVPHDRPGDLRSGEVRDCNRPALMTVIKSWGFEVIDLGIAKDTPGNLEQALRDAMRKVDVIITTGGVSMGELDLLKPIVERAIGGTIHFGRVAMKPGKPTTFATVAFKNNAGNPETRLIFSLPGNPAAAIVTLHLFVLPSLLHSSGVNPPGLPRVLVTVDHRVRLDAQRPEYHRAIVDARADGLLHATSTGGQRSSKVGSFKGANALLCLPCREGWLEKGQKVEALLMGRVLGL
ncbi:hypothetical protein MMC22_008196 [Lobaria immixta]|nr:hypothetical protein [Lobaria immixta]